MFFGTTESCLDIDHLSSEKKTGPIHLGLVGLTAGWQAGWQAGWLADEVWIESESFKIL